MSNSRACILLLSLDKWDSFESMNAHLLSALHASADVQQAGSASEAIRRLSQSPGPRAVIATDAAVTEHQHSKVLSKLVEFVKSGGILVFACQFSSFASPPDLATMFKRAWNLPWVSGSYHRADFEVNSAASNLGKKNLVPQYSMKALHLKNVAKKAKVYLPTRESGEDRSETPAALALVGKGRLGYIGDVNSETETTNVILAMCLPADQAGISSSASTGQSQNATTVTQISSPTGSQDAAKKPTILILSFEKEEFLTEHYPQLYSGLRKNATVHEVETVPAALQRLSVAPPPSAVLATDAALSRPAYGPLVTRLVAYVRAGGRLVLGCQFSLHTTPRATAALFQRFGLPWAAGSYHRTTFALNPAGVPPPLAHPPLVPAYSMKAQHVQNVAPGAMVYVATDASRVVGALAGESPAVCARVGAGFVGYVGDINGEQGSLRLLIAMCGVEIQPGDLGSRRIASQTTFTPGAGFQNTYEVEDEIPLPAGSAPATQLATRRPRDAEVRWRVIEHLTHAARSRTVADGLKEEGNRYFKQHEWKKAAGMYHDAAVIGGPHPVYVSNLAVALLKLEMWDEAESAAQRALRYEPKNVKARYRRGLARKEMGDYSGAASDFRAALRLEPESAASRAELTHVLAAHAKMYGTPLEDDDERPEEKESCEDPDIYSDSDDSLHDGNGKPCRFYNQEGCRDSKTCRFKHSPDTRSVRDELGRNVCIGWLLGACPDTRCSYAHDKLYLRGRGWWTDEQRLAPMRECLHHLGEPTAAQVESVVRAFGVLWRQDLWEDVMLYEDHDDSEDVDSEDFLTSLGLDTGRMGSVSTTGYGFTQSEEEELLSQGVKPWDPDARSVLNALSM